MNHDEYVQRLRQRIVELVEAGDLAGLRAELETHPLFDDFDEARGALLALGIQTQDVRMVTAALEFGANPAEHEAGLLDIALDANADNTVILELLLARGADPNPRLLNDYTPLHRAVESDNVLAAEALLRHGADANAATQIDAYETPLMLAARQGKLDMIRLLLRHGANPQYKNRLGQTAASVAAKRSRGVIEDMLRGD
jgi:hypothetical protein